MSETVVVDTSTLVALERADLLAEISQLDCTLLIPETVGDEFNADSWSDVLQKESLRGRSKRLVERLMETGMEKGEAACLALAHRETTGFIVADDRKLLRQRFHARERHVKEIVVYGFSFLLHRLAQQNIITGQKLWKLFKEIIVACDWERSVVHDANYTFLKDIGYEPREPPDNRSG